MLDQAIHGVVAVSALENILSKSRGFCFTEGSEASSYLEAIRNGRVKKTRIDLTPIDLVEAIPAQAAGVAHAIL